MEATTIKGEPFTTENTKRTDGNAWPRSCRPVRYAGAFDYVRLAPHFAQDDMG